MTGKYKLNIIYKIYQIHRDRFSKNQISMFRLFSQNDVLSVLCTPPPDELYSLHSHTDHLIIKYTVYSSEI